MNNVGIMALYAVAAAAVLLGLAMLFGMVQAGRVPEGLVIIGIGVAAALWARTSSTGSSSGAS